VQAADLSTPIRDAPVLMPAYAHLWSQTAPIPKADPDVALFLHGPDRSPASVQIVWRADIDEARDLRPAMGKGPEAAAAHARLVELFKLMPPRAAEAIEVPLWAACAWLDRPGSSVAGFSDAVERATDTDEQAGSRRRTAFRWAGEDSDRTGAIFGRGLRNGDLIVVPAAYGGCDQWGWNPKPADDAASSGEVADVADAALWPYRSRRFAVRVTPELVVQSIAQARTHGGDAGAPVDREGIAAGFSELLAQHEGESARDLLDRVLDWCKPKHEASGLPESLDGVSDVCLPARLEQLSDRCKGGKPRVLLCCTSEEEPPHGVVFFAPRGLDVENDEADIAALPSTESDDLGVASDRAVPLLQHCNEVRAWAEGFAARAGLSRNESAAVALAAHLHDPGKADRRFQTFLAGGDPYGPDAGEPLAKSGHGRLPRDAWDRAGLPERWRHEALSVRLAALHGEFKKAHDPLLVLWLIGTHHGHGRPLFPHADSLDAQERGVELPSALGGRVALSGRHGPQSLAFDFDGRDWAQMFEELKKKYGIWGLARLEAFVRLADHRASELGAPPTMAGQQKEAAE
jgi:CRISPR-associated endonuclease/helicase Cas3